MQHWRALALPIRSTVRDRCFRTILRCSEVSVGRGHAEHGTGIRNASQRFSDRGVWRETAEAWMTPPTVVFLRRDKLHRPACDHADAPNAVTTSVLHAGRTGRARTSCSRAPPPEIGRGTATTPLTCGHYLRRGVQS